MTSLQIDYWKFEETKRSNLANEAETHRHNVTTEMETERHNKATEAIGWAQVGELSRHNQATEEIQLFQAETSRLHEVNWKDVQDANIAIQRDANDIARDRVKLQEEEIGLGYERLELDQLKESHDYEVRSRNLDVAEEQLELQKSEQARKWVDTLFDDAVDVWHEVTGNKGSRRGWLNASA